MPTADAPEADKVGNQRDGCQEPNAGSAILLAEADQSGARAAPQGTPGRHIAHLRFACSFTVPVEVRGYSHALGHRVLGMPADRSHRMRRLSPARSAHRRGRTGTRTVADLIAERLAESARRPEAQSRAPGHRGGPTVADLVAERWPEVGASTAAPRPTPRTRGPVAEASRPRPIPSRPARSPKKVRVWRTRLARAAAGRRLWRTDCSTPAVKLWVAGPGAATLAFVVLMLGGWVIGGAGSTEPSSPPKASAGSTRHAEHPAGVIPRLSTDEVPGMHMGPIDCSRPARILTLGRWKLTLPVGVNGRPTEILGPRLQSYTSAYFAVSQACNAVDFRAPVDGVTTVDSQNPRSELRQMSSRGDLAAWSSTSGRHTMVLTEAFTRVPDGNPQVVGGQIHDADEDISVFRLEGTNLYVTNGDDSHYQLVTSSYTLGTPFEAKYVVGGGVIRAYVDNHLVATINKAFDGAYFKAGAYTQANCGDASPCSRYNYGEVQIYALKVSDGSA